MANYSKNELVDMIFILGECEKNCLLASRIYKARYPDRERYPREETFERVLQRFIQTGNINYVKETREKVVTHEDNEFQVITSLVENPHTSVSIINKQLKISETSIRRIIKKYKFHPYHIQLHQELLERDYGARMLFCNWSSQKLQEVPDFFKHVLFCDEATFHKNGFVNRHNFHYYSDVNPHQFRTRSQHKWTINVWGGIINTTIVGPFFLTGILLKKLMPDF